MMVWLRSSIVFLVLYPYLGLAQNVKAPEFSSFLGKVYKLPADSLQKGFRPYINQLDPYATIEWSELNFPSRSSDDFYPGIDLKSSYGIDFHSQMTIAKSGLYLFGLKSDDGSRLWIDNKLVLNNDVKSKDRLGHMELCADSVALLPGTYDLRIWYCQAYPTAMGIQFRAKMMRELDSVAQEPPLLLTFKFASGKWDISTIDSTQFMNSLLGLKNIEQVQIAVKGYADHIGSAISNHELSLKRATEARDFIRRHFALQKVSIEAIGEVQPDVSSDLSENRKVEIRIERVSLYSNGFLQAGND